MWLDGKNNINHNNNYGMFRFIQQITCKVKVKSDVAALIVDRTR